MKRKLFTICLASLQFACAAENLNNKSYEWDIYPVPANAGDGMVWKLHPQSDDFNYIADERIKEKSSMPNGLISIIIIGQGLLLQYGRETMFPFQTDSLNQSQPS